MIGLCLSQQCWQTEPETRDCEPFWPLLLACSSSLQKSIPVRRLTLPPVIDPPPTPLCGLTPACHRRPRHPSRVALQVFFPFSLSFGSPPKPGAPLSPLPRSGHGESGLVACARGQGRAGLVSSLSREKLHLARQVDLVRSVHICILTLCYVLFTGRVSSWEKCQNSASCCFTCTVNSMAVYCASASCPESVAVKIPK